MATFRKRNEKFEVVIRKKNLHACASFQKEEDAKLWAAWKEDLADQIAQFNPKSEDLITVGDAIDIKLQSFKAEDRNYADYKFLKNTFSHILTEPLSFLNYENMKEEWELQKSLKVFVGGIKNGTNNGREKLPSPVTVLKKFILLNGVVNHLIEKKLTLVNNIQPFITHIRKTLNERE